MATDEKFVFIQIQNSIVTLKALVLLNFIYILLSMIVGR